MDPTSHHYTVFADGVRRWSPNLTSAAWVMYSPSHELIHIDEIRMGSATNNQAEYDGVNGLLVATLQLEIFHRHLLRLLAACLPVEQLLPGT